MVSLTIKVLIIIARLGCVSIPALKAMLRIVFGEKAVTNQRLYNVLSKLRKNGIIVSTTEDGARWYCINLNI